MRNETSYEWVAEHVDEHGDIQDLWHEDRLSKEFVSQSPQKDCVAVHIGLIRRIGNDINGEVNRHYWYPAHPELNEDNLCSFNDPPKRFIAEARKFGLLA